MPVCFSLKKQKEVEPIEIKKSALDDSEMSEDEHKKDHIDKMESNHIKPNKSNTSVKKNALQNTAKLGRFIKIYIFFFTSI